MLHIITKKYLYVRLPLVIKFAEEFELTNVLNTSHTFLITVIPVCIQAAHLINIGSGGSVN